MLKERSRLEDALEARTRDQERSARRLTIAHDRIAALESETHAREREARIEELERSLEAAHAEIDLFDDK